jgi:hypothetical protein
MSHIAVGERLSAMSPEMVGHVVRGAGHFMEQGTGLVQEFAQHLPEIPYIVANSLPDLTNPQTWENWQWSTLSANYGEGSFLANSNHESTAAETALRESIERDFFNMLDVAKDLSLCIGSALAGDAENAVAYGAAAVEKYVSGMGPTPGQGTCPPVPDNGR